MTFIDNGGVFGEFPKAYWSAGVIGLLIVGVAIAVAGLIRRMR